MAGISYKVNNKRGSFAVFSVMVFAAMLIMVGAAVKGAGWKAADSVSYTFGRLWGISIVAEYDICLKERYGILGFWGNEASVAQKLDMYADYSFSEKDYIERSDAVCDLRGYGLDEPDNLMIQIKSIMLHGISPEKAHDRGETGREDRSVTSEWIIKGLPSYGRTEGSYLSGLISKLRSGMDLDEIGSGLALNRYIAAFFKDAADDKDLPETYFRNEVEYIISGQLDEKDAKEKTGNNIRTLRNALNLFYLYSCAPKREAVFTLAAALTPGPAVLLTQAALMEIWAFAEAENDMGLLYDNKTVPFIKKDSNWALSLENVFGTTDDDAKEKVTEAIGDPQKARQHEEGGYISPQVTEGAGYQDYLMVLLCGIGDDTKLYRIMDLIQINMKYVYRDDFLLKEYSGGLAYTMEINGKDYSYEEAYQKDDM